MKKLKLIGLLFICVMITAGMSACGSSEGGFSVNVTNPTISILSDSVITYKESNTKSTSWNVVTVTIIKNSEGKYILDSIKHLLEQSDGWLLGDPQEAFASGIEISNGESGIRTTGEVTPYNNKGETQALFENNKAEGENFVMHHFSIICKPKMILEITADLTYTFEYSNADTKKTISVTISLNNFKNDFSKLTVNI